MKIRENMIFIWVSGKYHSKDKYGLSVERLKKQQHPNRKRKRGNEQASEEGTANPKV